MVRIIVVFVLLMAYLSDASAQKLSLVSNKTFTHGEKLEYRVYFYSGITGRVPAGKGELNVRADAFDYNEKPVYHIIAKGWTTGVFRFFAKVDDVLETYIDVKDLVPYHFERHIRENRYRFDEKILFDQVNHRAVCRDTIIQLEDDIHDMLSALYYARIMGSTDISPGDSIPIRFFLDDSTYVSYVKYDGRDEIETDAGLFTCKRFKPMVVVGEVFTEDYPATIWVTDDNNSIPIRIESSLAVGSVRVELVNYSGVLDLKPMRKYEAWKKAKDTK
ncbi:MAG: DUF3108 domain-containing protein [Bacteroidales bacterium]|nr:DUF3108 domain-containing protein [Bacteroidales bacterium]